VNLCGHMASGEADVRGCFQEIKLYSNATERRKFEEMADLFAIIKVRHMHLDTTQECSGAVC
jgi:hypothetical protein